MSAKRKGVDDFWKKKFVRVFLPWMLVWLIMTLQNEKAFKMETIASLFTPNWFLQYLFVCYAIFYVSYRWMYRYRWYLLAFFTLVTFFFWGNIQAEQCCSFQIGVLLAEREDFFFSVERNIKKWVIISLLIFVTALVLKQIGTVRMLMENNFMIEHALNLVLKMSLGAFVMMSCAVLFRYISGKYAWLVGKMSYELYLVHLSLVIGLCYRIGTNPIAQVVVFIVVSFVASWILYHIDNRLLKVYSKIHR